MASRPLRNPDVTRWRQGRQWFTVPIASFRKRLSPRVGLRTVARGSNAPAIVCVIALSPIVGKESTEAARQRWVVIPRPNGHEGLQRDIGDVVRLEQVNQLTWR